MNLFEVVKASINAQEAAGILPGFPVPASNSLYQRPLLYCGGTVAG